MNKANSASRTNIYFLNFDGQVLTPGADDPVQNRSQLISQTVAIPTYLAGDPKRAAKIQSIIREVKAILAPYNIKIVTSRPQSGPYDMMVAGGSSRQAGLPAGIGAVAVIDCTAALPHHVSLLFDQTTGHEAARQIIGSLGISHGISASTKPPPAACTRRPTTGGSMTTNLSGNPFGLYERILVVKPITQKLDSNARSFTVQGF